MNPPGIDIRVCIDIGFCTDICVCTNIDVGIDVGIGIGIGTGTAIANKDPALLITRRRTAHFDRAPLRGRALRGDP